MGGISFWQLLIIAVIVVLLFGTKRLRTLGSDLGAAMKGFKNAMNDEVPPEQPKPLDKPDAQSQQSDAEFKEKQK